MNKEDIEFHKHCEQTRTRIKRLLKNGNLVEASMVIKEIENNVKAWVEYEKSVCLRAKLIKHMLIETSRQKQFKEAQLKKEIQLKKQAELEKEKQLKRSQQEASNEPQK